MNNEIKMERGSGSSIIIKSKTFTLLPSDRYSSVSVIHWVDPGSSRLYI